nr:sugar O-acetyltransferase [Lactococcus nasutitermitis]
MRAKNGDWYQFAKAVELQKIVIASAQKVQLINEWAKTDNEKAQLELFEFLPQLAKSAKIYFPITGIEYPDSFWVGEETFINAGLQIISSGRVTIGNHCFIGPNCQLFTANHHSSDKFLRRAGWQYDAPISIGDDCWLGGSVIILPGVAIGENVVIGAGSVVTKDIPSNCLVAGNPAHLIRKF